jgi:hypothetical protein
VAAAIGGAVGGEVLQYSRDARIAGAIGGAVTSATAQVLEVFTGRRKCFSLGSFTVDTAMGYLTGYFPGTGKWAPGITRGTNSFMAIARSNATKLANGTIRKVSIKSSLKEFVGTFLDKGMIPGAGAGAAAAIPLSGLVDQCGCQ